MDYSFWEYRKFWAYSVKICMCTRTEDEWHAIAQNYGPRVLNNLKF